MNQKTVNPQDWLNKNGITLSGAKGISSHIVSIDKNAADALLSFNFDRQRLIRPKYVQRLKDHLSEGTFMPASPIRICSKNGEFVLTDGQHRLTAISEADARADFVVTFVDSDPEIDYAIVDTVGMLRSLADTLAALDRDERLPDSKSTLSLYASALRVVMMDFNSWDKSGNSFTAKSRNSFYEFACQFEDAIQICNKHMRGGELRRSGKAYMRAGILAVAVVTAKSVSEELFKSFWTESINDDGLRQYDPRKKLHEECSMPQGSSSGGSRQIVDSCAAAKCWNAFIAKEEIRSLKKNVSMPKIALTEYPLRLNKGKE